MKHHLITGATGFVGSAIILEILTNSDDKVVGIVRADSDRLATERLANVLHRLVEGYDLPSEVHDQIKARVVAVVGDLEIVACGVNVGALKRELGGSAIEFWHSAASLQYHDRHSKTIDQTNVGGTENALDLALGLATQRFNMISTAFVAGPLGGLIRPEPGDLAAVNNLYERSKIRAELAVIDRGGHGLSYRILRPSVVIGHSRTLFTTSADGYYGFTRGLRKFARLLDRTQPGLRERLELRVLTHPDGPIDLVPVDHVAADAVALSTHCAPQGIYHLSNVTPPSIGDGIRAGFAAAGLLEPIFVDSAEGFTSIESRLRARLDFYNSYMVNPKRFDRSSVATVLGGSMRVGLPMDQALLERYCRAFIAHDERDRVATVVR